MKSIFMLLLLATFSTLMQGQDLPVEARTVYLPSCTSFQFPQETLENDALYIEHFKSDSILQKAVYNIIDGERVGQFELYSDAETPIAKGIFEKGKLQEINLWKENKWVLQKLKYDAPFWFFNRNVLRATGKTEQDGKKNFIWLAGQRYKILK